MFLAYLFLTIGWSIALEDHGRDLDVVPEVLILVTNYTLAVFLNIWCYFKDYEFDLESGLMKGARHTTSVACMVIAPLTK